MDISIYTRDISVDLISKIKNRFKEFHMDIDFHSGFKFDEKRDNGFLPIQLKVHKGYSTKYDEIDYEIISGFELFFTDYDYNEDLKNIREYANSAKRKSFFLRLFGQSKVLETMPISFVADAELDPLLQDCNKVLLLNFKSWNKSELRVSLFFAAILAELTNGVVYDPHNGRYLSGEQALNVFPLEIEEYEESFSREEFKVNKFEGWI